MICKQTYYLHNSILIIRCHSLFLQNTILFLSLLSIHGPVVFSSSFFHFLCFPIVAMYVLSVGTRVLCIDMCLFFQVRVAANGRNSAWAAYDGRNRREIKQGDRYYLYPPHKSVCLTDHTFACPSCQLSCLLSYRYLYACLLSVSTNTIYMYV